MASVIPPVNWGSVQTVWFILQFHKVAAPAAFDELPLRIDLFDPSCIYPLSPNVYRGDVIQL